MSTRSDIVITGFGIEVPSLKTLEDLLNREAGTSHSPYGEGMFDPRRKLGKKGLLYKDQATKLALCAVQEALLHSGLPLQETEESRSTGVVVSSNLGNVDTICRMVQTIHQRSTRDLSPMDGPNASSNVIASTIAIRFHCHALNLMLCNGSTSGLDALYIAVNAIKARRACRMLVVGVEPHNDVVQRLMTSANAQEPIRAAAACIILETAEQADARGATIYGTLSGYLQYPQAGRERTLAPAASPEEKYTHQILMSQVEMHYGSSPVSSGADGAIISALRADGSRPSLWLVPDLTWPENRSLVNKVLAAYKAAPPEVLDLSPSLGELYGAQGIFQCIAACLWRQRHVTIAERGVVLVTCGGTWGDGIASMLVKNATMAS